MATGFRDDTEKEVETLLTSVIVEAGMSRERNQIKCPAKPITHAFLEFTDNEERDKYIRSANMQKRELREREMRKSPVMDLEERFQQKKKRLAYIKFCLSKKHEIRLTKITLNHMKKHVSVEGQMVIKTCEKWISQVPQVPKLRE